MECDGGQNEIWDLVTFRWDGERICRRDEVQNEYADGMEEAYYLRKLNHPQQRLDGELRTTGNNQTWGMKQGTEYLGRGEQGVFRLDEHGVLR